MTKCRDCDGHGLVWQHYGPDQYDFDAVTCSRCNGDKSFVEARPYGVELEPLMKPIETEAEYQSALRELESLWDAEPMSPNGDRFVAICREVEAYEDERWPCPPMDED